MQERLEFDLMEEMALMEELAPAAPAPTYRPYTPAEAVQFLGRQLDKNGHAYVNQPVLLSVSKHGVTLTNCEGLILYETLVDEYTWANSGEPCGMKEVK